MALITAPIIILGRTEKEARRGGGMEVEGGRKGEGPDERQRVSG